jgi:four helix bundle protein
MTEKKQEFVLSKQVLRSGTSIGANLCEAICGFSKKEFLSKLSISLKECNETLYWLRLIKETKYITETQFNSIYSECEILMKMLVKSIKTTKKNIESK